MLKPQYKQLKMVGAISAYFVAFNMIAEDLADKIGDGNFQQWPMKYFVVIFMKTEFMKNRRITNKIIVKHVEQVQKWLPSPCLILTDCVKNQ